MFGSATFTTVTSSSNMKIARQTARRVHHFEAMPRYPRFHLPPSTVVLGGNSIQVGRVFGIRIGVDVSWFFVLFLIIVSLTNYYEDAAVGSNAFLLAAVSALLFFLSIVLHELGHAVIAIRHGIPIT